MTIGPDGLRKLALATVMLALPATAAAMDVPADNAGGKALHDAMFKLCPQANAGTLSPDDAASLAAFGFKPGPESEEANLFLGGVQGQLVVAETPGLRIRLSTFAPNDCKVYMFGPGRKAAWDYLRAQLTGPLGYRPVSGSGADAADSTGGVFELPVDARFSRRVNFSIVEGYAPLISVNSYVRDAQAAD